jgi:hypothetical protein
MGSRRRWLRFSVRTLLTIVAFIGCALGWAVRLIDSARAQRDAAAAIKNAGGSVGYDWEINHGRTTGRREPSGPKWLVDLIGIDFFGHVTFVTLPETAPDEVLVHVGTFSRLDILLNRSTKITDTGLAHLHGLTALRLLQLRKTKVTDRGLLHLPSMCSLQSLDLRGTQITDDGLAHLAGMASLKHLDLRFTQVTDGALRHLTSLVNLVQLDLDDTKVTKAGKDWLQPFLPKTTIIQGY